MLYTRISINYDSRYVFFTAWNCWIPSSFLGSLLMTAQLPTGTLLDAIVCGNSCRMKNCAFSPSEKKKSTVGYFSSQQLFQSTAKWFCRFMRTKGQNKTRRNKTKNKTKRNKIWLRNNVLISRSMTGCGKREASFRRSKEKNFI